MGGGGSWEVWEITGRGNQEVHRRVSMTALQC